MATGVPGREIPLLSAFGVGLLLTVLCPFVAGAEPRDPGKLAAPTPSLYSFLRAVPRAASDSLANMPNPSPAWQTIAAQWPTLVAGKPTADELRRIQSQLDAVGYRLTLAHASTLDRRGGYRHLSFSVVHSLDGVGATIVFNHRPIRDVWFETPHPILDRATLEQSAAFLVRLGARGLLIAGARRCASVAYSECSGKTKICGSRERYRRSDVAHDIGNIFHLAHEQAAKTWERALIVQLHGFSNPGSPVWFLLSDGATRRHADLAPQFRIRDSLRTTLGHAEIAASCQDVKDKDIETRWLCGRWNVQGRHVNGSPDPCSRGARRASGRFLHIEQVFDEIRRPFRELPADAALSLRGPGALLTALDREARCLIDACPAPK